MSEWILSLVYSLLILWTPSAVQNLPMKDWCRQQSPLFPTSGLLSLDWAERVFPKPCTLWYTMTPTYCSLGPSYMPWELQIMMGMRGLPQIPGLAPFWSRGSNAFKGEARSMTSFPETPCSLTIPSDGAKTTSFLVVSMNPLLLPWLPRYSQFWGRNL